MAEKQHWPDFDRLSVLVATILLAYASGRFVDLPARVLDAQLPGFYLALQINTNTVIALLVGGLTASGTYWVLDSHPNREHSRRLQHLLLPALTALVIGLPLNQLPFTPLWWAVFVLGGLALLLVFLAEYLVLDPQDRRQPLAAALLTALSFALFLLLAINLRAAELRLFLLLPALTLAAGLVGLRAMQLRLAGRWQVPQAAAIALLLAQLAAALHYLPLSPLTFGLLLVGPAYAVSILVVNFAQGRPPARASVEPAIVLAVVLGIALWIR